MDLREYFGDLHKAESLLERAHPDGIVYVTSLFHRERNSTPGSTMSASCRNAARVITDGTHREATQEEIEAFMAHQQSELRKNTRSEQMNKKQYIVVVDQKEQLGQLEPVLAGVGGGDTGQGPKGRQATNK